MVITINNSTHDMISELQSIKGKTKLKIYQNISDYYNEMNNRSQRGTFHLKNIFLVKMFKVLEKLIMK